MHNRLKKIYFIVLTPAIVGFLAVWILRQFKLSITVPEQYMAVIAPVIFILAAIFAIAGPILYRSLFAHRQRHLVKMPLLVMYKFERNLTSIALLATYLALVGDGLQLPRFHLAATLLMALYAIYYSYPYEKRIRFDDKIFRGRRWHGD